MPPGFGRLPFLGRRSTHAESSPSDGAAAVRPPIDLELAPVGPPVLLPSAIFRQVLFEATELVPAWAMPRPGLGQVTTPNEPKATTATKAPRRPRATKTSAAKPATATPRTRTRKRDV
jgi:hypothetical protein